MQLCVSTNQVRMCEPEILMDDLFFLTHSNFVLLVFSLGTEEALVADAKVRNYLPYPGQELGLLQAASPLTLSLILSVLLGHGVARASRSIRCSHFGKCE